MLGNLLEITPSTLLRSEGRQRHHYVKLGRPNDNDSAAECVAKAKADPNFRIPRRLGSPTKRREFVNALTEMLLVDMDADRIESWHSRANLQDGKEKEDGEDDSDDDDGAAQGVSSGLQELRVAHQSVPISSRRHPRV
jgi:hypothetical protein